MIRWITLFIDVDPDRFDAAVAFWSAATATSPSPPRGDDGQFLTLEPASGDAYVRMQRLTDGPRTHLDLHVDDIADATRRAIELGATLVAESGHNILRSPGGYPFCFVAHHGETAREPQPTNPVPHRLEMLCIDAPARSYEAEGRFWSALTGMELNVHPDFPEFGALSLWKQGLPCSILVQHLGDDDERADVHAHLDISAGSEGAALVDHHLKLGAEIVRHHDAWTVLRDPAGLEYCITDAPPR